MPQFNLRQSVFRGVIGGGLLFLLSPIASNSAFAHDELISSAPGDGSTVSSAKALTLRFSESLIPTGYQLQVTGPTGAVAGSPRISGSTLREDFPRNLPAGDYRVSWRVVSEDGHPISGKFAFTVDEVRPVSRPSPQSTLAAPTLTESTLIPETNRNIRNKTESSGTGVALVLGAAAGGSLVFALGVLGWRRRRQPATVTADPHE